MKPGVLADALFTLAGISFAWASVSMLLLLRQWRKLGLTPEGRLKVLSGPRPSDPDELFMWWCFLSMCVAALLGVLFVLLLVFGR